MRVIIIGIMQGSLTDSIHDQSYRKNISKILKKAIPGVKIIDPDKLHPNRLSYNLMQARNMFKTFIRESTRVDLVIAYLPYASMGTAIEMWEAYKAKVPILTISNLKKNWVIKLFSTEIFSTTNDLSNYLLNDKFKKLINKKR